MAISTLNASGSTVADSTSKVRVGRRVKPKQVVRRRSLRPLLCETLEGRRLLTVFPGDGWSLDGGGMQDTDTGLVWSTEFLDFGAYGGYSNTDTQIQNLTEGGQTDWRLATKGELLEAMSHGLENHHEFDAYWLWTSTAGKNNREHWAVNNSGHSAIWPNGSGWSSVAVRGTRTPAVYTDPNVRVFSTSLVTEENPRNDASEFPTSSYLTLALDTAPSADVVVPLRVSNPLEGLLSTSGTAQASSISLTFTPTNWNVPQWVGVAGVDDAKTDGDVTYSIFVDPATSFDSNYSGKDPADVSVLNRDNEIAWVLVSPTSGLVTSEGVGGTAAFTVKLNSPPNGNVYVNLASSDTSEGTVSPSKLTFTTSDWSVPQTVVVTGVEDSLPDGDMGYQIITSMDPSSSQEYLLLAPDPVDVSVVNADNDVTSITKASGTLNLSIPDPGTINSQISVPESLTITDVNVKLSINHTYDKDLRVYLIGPDSTQVELFSDVGGGGDNFTNTVLDDEATTRIDAGFPGASAPFTGSFKPEQPLSSFDNKPATGTWTLRVTDSTKRDRGTLVSWSLIVSGSPALPLLAATPGPGATNGTISLDMLQPILHEASARWQSSGTNATTGNIDVRIADLPGTTLGLASGNTIWLDENAAGWGWFIDTTPSNDSEFVRSGNQGEQDRMDLLTVVMHELGHVLGYDHDDDGVMAEMLAAGVRRADVDHAHAASVDDVFGQTSNRYGDSWLSEESESKRSWARRRR
jgi:subtilisin-like proprotein convertase family protein